MKIQYIIIIGVVLCGLFCGCRNLTKEHPVSEEVRSTVDNVTPTQLEKRNEHRNNRRLQRRKALEPLRPDEDVRVLLD